MQSVRVAPLVGAWIEIPTVGLTEADQGTSLLSWERGLKSSLIASGVTEIPSLLSWERGLKSRESLKPLRTRTSLLSWERGLKSMNPLILNQASKSLLSWERGLKSLNQKVCKTEICRSSRGSVDWNCAGVVGIAIGVVAPLVGAWIEIKNDR